MYVKLKRKISFRHRKEKYPSVTEKKNILTSQKRKISFCHRKEKYPYVTEKKNILPSQKRKISFRHRREKYPSVTECFSLIAQIYDFKNGGAQSFSYFF